MKEREGGSVKKKGYNALMTWLPMTQQERKQRRRKTWRESERVRELELTHTHTHTHIWCRFHSMKCFTQSKALHNSVSCDFVLMLTKMYRVPEHDCQCYTEWNVNQCILNGSVSLTFSCYTGQGLNPIGLKCNRTDLFRLGEQHGGNSCGTQP